MGHSSEESPLRVEYKGNFTMNEIKTCTRCGNKYHKRIRPKK